MSESKTLRKIKNRQKTNKQTKRQIKQIVSFFMQTLSLSYHCSVQRTPNQELEDMGVNLDPANWLSV